MITGKSGNTWYMTTPDGKAISRTDIPHDYYAAICKLLRYERLGLEPEQIEQLLSDNQQTHRRLRSLLDEMQAIIEG